MILIENENALHFDIQDRFPSGRLDEELLIQNCRIDYLSLGDFVYEKAVTLKNCFFEPMGSWLVNNGGYNHSLTIESCIVISDSFPDGYVPFDMASDNFPEPLTERKHPSPSFGFDCFSQNEGPVSIIGNIFYAFVDFTDSTFEKLLTIKGNIFFQGSNLFSDFQLAAQFKEGLDLVNNVGKLDMR